MAKSIGIDLGTTNTVAAIKQVELRVLENAEEEVITPSCVALKKTGLLSLKEEFIVGRNALEWLKQEPSNTVTDIKRLIGRNIQDAEIQEIISRGRISYELAENSRGTKNSISLLLKGREYSPEFISSLILKKICQDAEEVLKDKIEYVVITVPAYFNDKQKHATRTAAALAGLKVRRLLPEPTAAAISFGVEAVQGQAARTVLIFDFGGGTFDLSVLTISGGQFLEQGKGGNMWLGGVDLDNLIVDYVLSETARKYKIEDLRPLIARLEDKRKKLFQGELKAKAERAKIGLSAKNEVFIELLGVMKDPSGRVLDIEVELTREKFESLIAPRIKEMIELIDKMLEELHFTRDLIDDILLVGGSSQIPGLVAALKKEYGTEKVRLHERPLLAIAEGAALLCHRLSEKVECPGCAKESPQTAALCPHCGFNLEKEVLEHGVLDIVHSAAHDYSIQLENNMRHLLIKKNSPLPCEVGESFELVNPEQKLVHLKFFNTVNDREAVIGELWLGLAEDLLEKIPDRKKPLNIDLTFRVDENNIIGVTAAMKEFPEVKISRTLSRGYADEKLFFSLEELINDANQKKYSHYSTLDLEYRALAIIRDLNNILQTDTGLVNEEIYRRAVLKIETAAKFLSTDESSKPVIFYAQHLLERFGILLPPRVQEDIKKCIARLEKMEETGTYEENLSACRQLHEAVDEKKIGFSTLLMQIDKAAEFCSGENPSGSAKLYGDIEKIIEFATRREKEKIDSLLNEIMPEVNRIIEVHEEKPITIHKDITR